MKAAQESLEIESLERLELRAADTWQQYGFDLLLQTVLHVIKIEKLPIDRISAKCGRLIAAKASEQTRKNREAAWLEKLKNADVS